MATNRRLGRVSAASIGVAAFERVSDQRCRDIVYTEDRSYKGGEVIRYMLSCFRVLYALYARMQFYSPPRVPHVATTTANMSFALQKQRQYSQLSNTLQKLSRELELTRNLMDQTSTQLNAMGKFAALHAAQYVPISLPCIRLVYFICPRIRWLAWLLLYH